MWRTMCGRATTLDAEARRRANSVYFPDRVLPMLPEALSDGLCSLRPEQDRACLAVHLWYDLAARQAQASVRARAHALAPRPSTSRSKRQPMAFPTTSSPLLERVIHPLYGAYAVLAKDAAPPRTLDLDLPEAEVRLDPDGRPQAIVTRPRLDRTG